MSSLSAQTIAVVKATVPVLEIHGLEIVKAMYGRLFQNPAIRDLFNQSHHGETGSQPKALTGAILAYARNIDNLGTLGAAVERIAQKHVGLQINAEHYPAVADALLAAISDVLGAAATDEVLTAWGEAYWFLANILIAREQAIYGEAQLAQGGWAGWREFNVREKVRESDIITSFLLEPADGETVALHKPGQYLTFCLDLPENDLLKRNYSISAAPNGSTYRISVKREPDGLASNWLHDQVDVGTMLKVAPPAGEFFMKEPVQRPIILLSGGVGLTPMMSMVEALVAKRATVPIHFVHGTLSGATHAMSQRVRSLAADNANVHVATFYQQPRPSDEKGLHYDTAGFISMDWLREHTPLAEADVYVCGPREFLRTFVNGLQAAGVAPTRIHYEFFGPADDLLAA
jgi:nitric oxide dioxygenase